VSKLEHKFVPGTEQHLAAVWYAMVHAQADYEKNRSRLEAGRLNPWSYLRKIQAALGMQPVQKSYWAMRDELQHFALTFGIEGLHPDAPINPADAKAMKEFGES
jgi:hypothetical protein